MTGHTPWREVKALRDLTADQLAQYRGCEPDHECYAECMEAAQRTLDNGPDAEDPDELKRAAKWTAAQDWIEP